MHLVLITQKIDESDDILGFTVHWLRSLALRVDRLSCLTLELGDFPSPPPNVAVHSLGKETEPRRWRLALALQKELARICSSAPVDAILAHMAPVFAVLSYPVARWYGVPTYLWYTHRAVDPWLRLATAASSLVFTASPESFRLPTRKLRVMGHGIPLQHFRSPGAEATDGAELLCVCRISPVKKLDVLIRAMSLLPNEHLRLRIVGDEAVATDRTYHAQLEKLTHELGIAERVAFEGAVPYRQIPSYYARSLLTVDPCAEGFDKAVLESMASGRVVLTANPAFAALFGSDAEKLIYRADDPEELASKIEDLLELEGAERRRLSERLLRSIAAAHDLDRLTEKMVKAIGEDRNR